MKIYKMAEESITDLLHPDSNNEYMIENGMLYDFDGEDVFNMKELIRYKVPLFKSPQEANNFLEELEKKTNRTFGKVPNKDFLHDLRYKDTKKEKEKEKREDMDQFNRKWKQGNF